MPSIHVLWNELRRRRVLRVAAVYGVTAWVVVEVASVIGPALLLPDWLTRIVVVVAALGFPLALVLAWAFDVTPDRGGGPAAVEALAAGPRAPARRKTAAVRVLAVAAVVSALLLGGWLLRQSGGRPDLPRGAALDSALAALKTAGDYRSAFDLATAAVASGEAVADSTWPSISDRLSVETDPAGARVLIRSLDIDDGAWKPLGTTPIRELRLPRADHLLRIERDGYAAIERLASSAQQRGELRLMVSQPVPGVAFRPRLRPAAAFPDDMVSVPGGRYTLVSPSLQNPTALLDDYLLDRHEVSNADFAGFIDEGGYRDDRYWVGAPAAARAGVDRTGLPGPREWSGQRFPAGSGTHPVTGVTWYEAAAYCRSRERRLPTLFEWEKAARDGRRLIIGGVFMPWGPVGPGGTTERRANFGGTGTRPVTDHPFGISPYGAYGMAGNAKEWLASGTPTARAVTGGSWEDPIYMFSQVGALDPMSASPALGFRCARHAVPHPSASEQGAGALAFATETPVYDAADDRMFAAFLSHYRYEPRPPDAEVQERVTGAGWVRERIGFNSPDGTRLTGWLYLPTAARPPFQTLAYVPGADVYGGVPILSSVEWIMGPVIRSGRALFTVALEGTTGRPYPADYQSPDSWSVRFRDALVRDAIELRAGIDYLATRGDIDMDALVYAAVSRGAGSRLPFAAVDPRYRAAVLIGGGIDERVRPTLPEVDNVNFAPRVATPVLLLNGREDEEHPWTTRGLPLWNLLPDPKELVLIEGAGHVPPEETRVRATLEFLDRVIGPVYSRLSPD